MNETEYNSLKQELDKCINPADFTLDRFNISKEEFIEDATNQLMDNIHQQASENLE